MIYDYLESFSIQLSHLVGIGTYSSSTPWTGETLTQAGVRSVGKPTLPCNGILCILLATQGQTCTGALRLQRDQRRTFLISADESVQLRWGEEPPALVASRTEEQQSPSITELSVGRLKVVPPCLTNLRHRDPEGHVFPWGS